MMMFLLLCLLYDLTLTLSLAVTLGLASWDIRSQEFQITPWEALFLGLLFCLIPSFIYGIIMVLCGDHKMSRRGTICRSVGSSLFLWAIYTAFIAYCALPHWRDAFRTSLPMLPSFFVAGVICGYWASLFPRKIAADWYGYRES